MKLLPIHQGGAAFGYWDSLPDAAKSNYDTVKANLKTVVGQAAYLSTFQTYVNAHTRLPSGALPVFAADNNTWWRKLFPHIDKTLKTEKHSDYSLLELSCVQLHYHEPGVRTQDTALQFAIQIETANHVSRVFSYPDTLQRFSQAPVSPAVSPFTPTHPSARSNSVEPTGFALPTPVTFRKCRRH